MAKYDFEFKKKIVQASLNGEGGYRFLAKTYNIPSKIVVETWVEAYRKFGDKGLFRSRQKKEYSFNFKLAMVECYLSGEISYKKLALQNSINNPSMIANWVRCFRLSGSDGLRAKPRVRKSTLGKKKITKPKKEIISIEQPPTPRNNRLKELEEENLKLRIEVAFLKELRMLRLEEEALLKKQRESYTASEENSD